MRHNKLFYRILLIFFLLIICIASNNYIESFKNEKSNKLNICIGFHGQMREFIKNGEVIKTIKCGGVNCDELINAYEDDFDFLIYSINTTC